MGKFHALLNLRLKQKESEKPKMTALAERTTSGNLSSFSGVFRVTALGEREKENLKNLLQEFRENESYDVESDLSLLMTITQEVKAITNQAVILHGERIKKAQEILKAYRDGAFTAWLIATYGNRQTPYNFLQYYEFYTSMPASLHNVIDTMPRQAIYTLASRTGDLEKKEEFVLGYTGQPKKELLAIIRSLFPLPETDKRLPNLAAQLIGGLSKLKSLSQHGYFKPTEEQKEELLEILEEITKRVKKA